MALPSRNNKFSLDMFHEPVVGIIWHGKGIIKDRSTTSLVGKTFSRYLAYFLLLSDFLINRDRMPPY
jgi:hypothetical protein